MREHRESAGRFGALRRFAALAALLPAPLLAQIDDPSKGTCAGDLGDTAAIVAACSAYLDRKPSDAGVAEAHRWRGKARVEANSELAAAIADLSAALAFDPRDRVALFYRGRAYEQGGDDQRALADFEAVTSLNRDDIFGWLGLANIYGTQKRYSLASQAYSEAVRIEPDNGTWYEMRGEAHWKMGELDKALADMDKAASLSAFIAEHNVDRQILRSMTGRSDEALAGCNAIAATKPSDSRGYLCQGIVYLHMKRSDEAIAAFAHVAAAEMLARDPFGLALFAYGRGVARRLKGEPEGDADVRAAEEMQPGTKAWMQQRGVSP